jgi:hypothetical protein
MQHGRVNFTCTVLSLDDWRAQIPSHSSQHVAGTGNFYEWRSEAISLPGGSDSFLEGKTGGEDSCVILNIEPYPDTQISVGARIL